MENVRFHVQDTMFALLVTYLVGDSRNVLADFDITWTEEQRSFTAGQYVFPIVKRLVGEPHQIPGINVVFTDEIPTMPFANRRGLSLTSTINIYLQAGSNPSYANRFVLQAQRKIDEALYGKGTAIIDLYSDPPVSLGKSMHWELLTIGDGWSELTDLANNPYLHRAKNVRLFYDDAAIA